MRGQERFDLAPQLGVVAASALQERGARFGAALQRGLERLLDLLPALRAWSSLAGHDFFASPVDR
jgi:hypothetical protein